MAEHKDILSDGAHVIHYWEVADSTALSALTPIIAELNKIALKVDDNTFWQCTEISPATFKLLNEISAEDIKTKYESNADTNALTDALLALLTTKKVKDVTTDAVNDKLVITYTDDTTAELNVTGGSGGEVDLTDYYTKSETDSLVDTKQDTLVSGTSIKTVNGQSVLGSGNIEIIGGVSEESKVYTESLTEPLSPNVGDEWFDQNNGILYKRISDGTNALWMAINSLAGGGDIVQYDIGSNEFILPYTRNGKRVYGIEVDFGALPNATTKSVAIPNYNASYRYWIDGTSTYSCKPSENVTFPLPRAHQMDGACIDLVLNGSNIQIITGDNRTTYTETKVVVHYTKD